MSLLFISDIHLEASNGSLTEKFIHFLESQAKQAQALYMLGDIFEVWIGDDDDSTWLFRIKNAVKQLTLSGVPVFILHGNRDFLLGKKFFRETSSQWLPDPSMITFSNKKILLLHGDTLCLDDKSYLQFRRFNRNRFIQQAYLTLPLHWRQKIANKVRHVSEYKHTELQDITDSEIPRLMSQYQADILIHGHTHRPAIHYFNLDQKPLLHIVLSDWHQQGNVLEIDAEGKARLFYF